MFIHYTFTSNKNHSNYVWTCYHTLPDSKNMVGYNATRYHNSNALRYALPHALLYILSQFNIDRPYWNALPHALRYIFFCIIWGYLQRVKSCRQIYKKVYSEKKYSVQKMYRKCTVTRVVTRLSYGNEVHYGLFMLSKSFLHLDADSAS